MTPTQMLVMLLVFTGSLAAGCTWRSHTPSTARRVPGPPTHSTAPIALNVVALGGPQRDEAMGQVIDQLSAQAASAPPRERLLRQADCGIFALHANDLATAKRLLEEVRRALSTISGTGAAERLATSLAGTEADKRFRGEPHERALIYLYRGLLFLVENDVENAQACFLQATLQDAAAAHAQARGDWLTLDLLLLVCKKLTDDPAYRDTRTTLLRRYAEQAAGLERLTAVPDEPVIVLLGTGRGPAKTLAQQNAKSEALTYARRPSGLTAVALLGAEERLPLIATDDLYIQALTRGRRHMDRLLAQKAGQRHAVEAQGTGLNVAGQIGASWVPGLNLLGMLAFEAAMEASHRIDSAADLRQLAATPGQLHLAILDRATLGRALTVEACAGERLVGVQTIELSALPPGPVVVVGLIPY